MRRSWSERIRGRIEMTTTAFRQDCIFSPRLAVYRMMDELTWRAGFKGISAYFHKKKDQYIQNYLKTLLKPVVEKYVNDADLGEQIENAPIWVCWWSGEETAPPLVRQCIRSIRKRAGNHPVNLITEKTYAQYLEVPEYIMEKLHAKKLGIANFSDYLRFSLLEKYGGIWLDATIFCSQMIPEDYYQTSLFSCRTNISESRFISNYRWTSFCFAGWKGHVLFRFFKEAWESYWRNNESAIDYLLVDYLIDIAYSHNDVVRTAIDGLLISNPHRDDLQAAMNAALPAQAWDQVLQQDTVLYKLSWREIYDMQTSDGKPSIFACFLNMEI